jgi:nitronate monooxygenase
MVAVRAFKELVHAAIEEPVRTCSSAGRVLEGRVRMGEEAGVPVVPIVGSPSCRAVERAVRGGCGHRRGVEAGGHLGTDRPCSTCCPRSSSLWISPSSAPEGVVTGADIKAPSMPGAAGVQMGSRFRGDRRVLGARGLQAALRRRHRRGHRAREEPGRASRQGDRNPFSRRRMMLIGELPSDRACSPA